MRVFGELVTSHDSVPRNGTAPVTDWSINTVQADPHRLALPPDLPPGRYTLITGLYNDSRQRVSGIDREGVNYPNQAVTLETLGITHLRLSG